MDNDSSRSTDKPRSGKRTLGMALTLLGSVIVFGFGWASSVVMIAGILVAAIGLWLAIYH